MGWFKKFKEKCSEIWNIYKQIRQDDVYYKEYLQGMRNESQNFESQFAHYDLKISDDGEYITHLIHLPSQFLSATDYMIFEKLNDATYFITEYLRNNFGLGQYVSVPTFYHVEDPTTPDVDSTAYLAQWTFQPIIEPEMKSKYMTRLYFCITGFLAVIIGSIFCWLFI